jgi:hypothetical protein
MTKNEAVKIIKRVRFAFAKHNIDLDSEETGQEYINSIISLDYKTMDSAVDSLKEQVKFTPTIADLLDQYSVKIQARKYEYKSDKICPICHNAGCVIVREYINDMPYDFAYYCTRCEFGKDFNYDGQKCADPPKSRKSDYKSQPIDKILDVEEFIMHGGFKPNTANILDGRALS